MLVYRLLLVLYPKSFRHEYGAEMRAIFNRSWRERGFPGRLLLLFEAIADTASSAAAAHWDLLQSDLRYAARTFRRSPGLAIGAIAIVGVGVGATTAAFSVTDFVLIRPLPFHDPARLVKVWEKPTGYSRMDVSPANYRDWKEAATSFESWGAYSETSENLIGSGEPQRVDAASVTADLFSTLGAEPSIGRRFTASDDRDGAAGTVILSYRLWQTSFGGRPGVVGEHITLGSEPFEIVGVMPRAFRFPSAAVMLWTPMRLGNGAYQDRTNTFLTTVARLKPGVSLEGARTELAVLAERSRRQYPRDNEGIDASIFRLTDEVTLQSRALLVGLSGAALCVLLVACANLANLLLARALARRRELAVRTALGAGRERLARQLVTESVLLALTGGSLGAMLTIGAVPLLARLVPPTLPIAENPGVDLRVIGFAFMVSIATGIGFGVVPAIRIRGDGTLEGLRDSIRAGGGARERLRSALVVSEIAASVVLLVLAGLLLRSLWRIQQIDPGFRADRVLTIRTALPYPQYGPTAKREAFYKRVLDEVRALPGVAAASYTSFAPLSFRGGIWPVSVDGRQTSPVANEVALLRYATPGFFSTLGIPLERGRDLSEADANDRAFVAVVSASFAARFFPGTDPLGRHFTYAFADREIVGIAGDIRARGLERVSEPQVYLSYKQVPDDAIMLYAPKDLLIRTSTADIDPLSLAPSVRSIVRAIDPLQPVSNVSLLSDLIDRETASRSTQARIIVAFAAIALFLGAVGIHSVLSFLVAQRAHEIGVRMALGAQPPDILTLVMKRSLLLAAAGTIGGAALAYAAGRFAQSLLVGVTPTDLPTFGTAVILSITMASIGTFVPTRRALGVDPIRALRSE